MLCNYLQNVAAITYIFVLQLSTFLFYNKQFWRCENGADTDPGSLQQYVESGIEYGETFLVYDSYGEYQ